MALLPLSTGDSTRAFNSREFDSVVVECDKATSQMQEVIFSHPKLEEGRFTEVYNPINLEKHSDVATDE